MNRKILYLESFAGIAGDMFTAAFLDAGLVDAEAVQAVPGLIGAEGVEVEITDVQKAGARSKRVRVVSGESAGGREDGVMDGDPAPQEADHHHVGEDRAHQHHHYPALVRQLQGSGLDPAAREFALRVFRWLAEAEADSHGVPVEKVAFHEVGAVDSVVDIAMAGVCVAAVAPDRVVASPVKLGRGSIRIHHGTYPVPPPASARLAVGMPVAPVPKAITRSDVELSTPTGLAILKALAPEFADGWPPGRLLAQGAGAGTRDLGEYPNVFRVALLEEVESGRSAGAEAVQAAGPAAAATPSYETDTVVEVRCNLDDETGERVAWLMETALTRGALDGWVTQVVGKKGRPALCLTLLVTSNDVPSTCDFLLRESSTFGVRYAPWRRFKLAREEEARNTPEGPVRYKVGRTNDGTLVKEKPEFEDLRKIWDRRNRQG